MTGTAGRDLGIVKLETLFDLPALGIRILGADTFGAGSRATVEIRLSNGETMTFETLREMGNAGILAAELAACTGALPKLAKPQALEAISLVRAIARTHRTISDNDTAHEWGQSYLGTPMFWTSTSPTKPTDGRRSRRSRNSASRRTIRSTCRQRWCFATSTGRGSCARRGSQRTFADTTA